MYPLKSCSVAALFHETVGGLLRFTKILHKIVIVVGDFVCIEYSVILEVLKGSKVRVKFYPRIVNCDDEP